MVGRIFGGLGLHPQPGQPRGRRCGRPWHRRRRDRARSRRRQDARAATWPTCLPRARATAPLAVVGRGRPARCRRCAACAKPSRPRQGQRASPGRAAAPAGPGRNSVLRLHASPILRPSRVPAAPPSAKPTAVSRPVRRVVLHAQGAAKSGRRSVKMRRSHPALSQNRRRVLNRTVAAYSPQGRSASVRP